MEFVDEKTYQLILSSKIHLETLFDSIQDPILVVSADRTVQRLNSAAARFMGKDFREIISKKCFEIFHGTHGVCEGCPHAAVLKHAEKGSIKIAVSRDNVNKVFDLRFFPLFDKSGNVTAMVEHYVDITEGEAAKSELEREHQHILQELKVARNIQEALLPPELPDIHGVKLEAEYRPVEDVGGDLYDFINIDREHVGFLIADVSGHGVPASLMGAMAKMSFYNHTPKNPSTMDVFERVNRDLFHNLMMEYYISGAYLIFNTVRNTLRYSRAGHPEPLLWRCTEGKVEKLHTPGYFLGIMSNGDYHEKEIIVSKGDRLLLYTDGVIEAMNPQGEKFGMERLIQWFADKSALTLAEQKISLRETIAAFTEGQKLLDDFTFLCIEFCDNSALVRFDLEKEFSSIGTPSVFRAAHPLEFTEGIGRIMEEMQKAWYPAADIEAVKYAAFDALELFHYTAPENSSGAYLAWHCDSEMVTVVVTDERYNNSRQPLDFDTTHPVQLKSIRSRVTTLQFPDKAKKLLFTRRNSKY
ncbi:MAG: SpoIIE family protein phosphatase [Fibrobacteres bacterium]|nr:SpoIIE family protein phosphatase [Fibrobacterota bacterium]